MSAAAEVEVQLPANGRWVSIAGTLRPGEAWGYVEGYKHGPGPRLPMRAIVQGTGKVLNEDPGQTEVTTGMMPQGFGFQWPYYVRAAERALERATKDVKDDAPVVAALLDVVIRLRQLVRSRTGEPQQLFTASDGGILWGPAAREGEEAELLKLLLQAFPGAIEDGALQVKFGAGGPGEWRAHVRRSSRWTVGNVWSPDGGPWRAHVSWVQSRTEHVLFDGEDADHPGRAIAKARDKFVDYLERLRTEVGR